MIMDTFDNIMAKMEIAHDVQVIVFAAMISKVLCCRCFKFMCYGQMLTVPNNRLQDKHQHVLYEGNG